MPTTLTSQMSLAIAVQQPVFASGGLTAFIFGSPSGVHGFEAATPLYLEADATPSGSLNLVCNAVTHARYPSNINLVVTGASTPFASSTTFFMSAPSGVFGSADLIVAGSGVTPGALPANASMVMMVKRPPEWSCDIFLAAPGTPFASGVQLAAMAADVDEGWADLVVPGVVGVDDGIVKVTIRGR